jgi:MFS superfamily sulfate permease-like transporter
VKELPRNLLASFVLFLIGIPLNLGIALASGVDPSMGLITGIVSGLVIGLLAGSPLQISGPATGLIAVVWQIIDTHGLSMLGPIVLLAGLLQIALGLSKWAHWFRAVSPAVIQGMLAGIGILIFASQFQVVLERTPKTSGIANLMVIPGAIFESLSTGKAAGSIGLALVTVIGIIVWGLFKPKALSVIPGSLMGVALAVLAAAVLQPEVQYVSLPADPLAEVQLLSLSGLGAAFSPSVLGSVVGLAFIATAQTLLTATAVDRLHSYERTDYNKEIIAQGVTNSLCGCLNALPVCGVIVRSSANVQAGATNRSANFMHGLWIGLFTLFLASWLELVPLAALAAVLVYTGYRLVDVKAIHEIRKYGSAELVIYLATLISVVMIGLLNGIVVGFVLSAARLIYVLTHYEAITRDNPSSGSLVLELKGSATFFTLPRLAEDLRSLPPRREVHLFMSGLNHIDHACLEHLMAWEEIYIQQGGQVFIEWDHLITRFHRPLSKEVGLDVEATMPPARQSHESYDILAARAKIVELERAEGWSCMAEAIAQAMETWIPAAQRPVLVQQLSQQLASPDCLRVSEVLMPHLMLEGIPRHEMVLVRVSQGWAESGQGSGMISVVALIGPLKTSEHLNILARLSNRAEEDLSQDIMAAHTRPDLRRALLKHSRFVWIKIESDSPSGVMAGKAVWQAAKILPPNILLAQIYRNGDELIPSGSTVLTQGDKVLILGSEEAVATIVATYLSEQIEHDNNLVPALQS